MESIERPPYVATVVPGFEHDDVLHVLLETLPHIAFLIRADGVAVHYNQRFVGYVGHAIGDDPAARTALHHPDDRDRLSAARTAASAGQVEYIVEARIRRHDGAYRWHRIHNKPLRRGGAIAGWLGTAVDIDDMRQAHDLLEGRVAARTAELEALNVALSQQIAERERSEQRYRNLYDRTPLALQSVDGQARLLDVNEFWLVLFGYQRDDVIGRCPTEFMTPDSAKVYVDRAWPAMLTSGGAVRTVEYQFVKRSGEIFDGRLSARGEFGADGKLIRSWSAIADVTAEKRAQTALQHAMKMEAIGQLTSGVAHDFNNLLTAIMGSLELLRRDTGADARATRLLDVAQTAAVRGSQMTRQLLAFSRKQRLQAEDVDLNALVERMLDLLQSTVGDRHRLQTDLASGLWIALADPTQLDLVLLNLAINARDAMPDGGIITIGTRNETVHARIRIEEPEPGEYAALSVSDTGTGIPPELQTKVFEPFFTTKEIGKGSGLGLSQVLGVAQQLGGGVRIDSTIGVGTRIDVFLRRAAGA